VSLHVVITSFLLFNFPFGRSDDKGTFPQNERPVDAHFCGANRRAKKQPIRLFANRLQESPVWYFSIFGKATPIDAHLFGSTGAEF